MAAVVPDAMQSPATESGDDDKGHDQIPPIKAPPIPTTAPTYSAVLTAKPANPRATDGFMYSRGIAASKLLALDRLLFSMNSTNRGSGATGIVDWAIKGINSEVGARG